MYEECFMFDQQKEIHVGHSLSIPEQQILLDINGSELVVSSISKLFTLTQYALPVNFLFFPTLKIITPPCFKASKVFEIHLLQ